MDDVIIPNPFEDENRPYDSLSLEDRVETIRTSVLELVEAVTAVLSMVVGAKAHTQEHCETFARHADAIVNVEERTRFLEQMLTVPEANDPQCEVDE